MEYAIVKWLHVLSSTLLFGTGLGSAFYMLVVSRTPNHRSIGSTASVWFPSGVSRKSASP
jgi:uncharacterized membrane protein